MSLLYNDVSLLYGIPCVVGPQFPTLSPNVLYHFHFYGGGSDQVHLEGTLGEYEREEREKGQPVVVVRSVFTVRSFVVSEQVRFTDLGSMYLVGGTGVVEVHSGHTSLS